MGAKFLSFFFRLLFNFRFIRSEVRPAVAQLTTVLPVHASKNLPDSLEVELRELYFFVVFGTLLNFVNVSGVSTSST